MPMPRLLVALHMLNPALALCIGGPDVGVGTWFRYALEDEGVEERFYTGEGGGWGLVGVGSEGVVAGID